MHVGLHSAISLVLVMPEFFLFVITGSNCMRRIALNSTAQAATHAVAVAAATVQVCSKLTPAPMRRRKPHKSASLLAQTIQSGMLHASIAGMKGLIILLRPPHV